MFEHQFLIKFLKHSTPDALFFLRKYFLLLSYLQSLFFNFTNLIICLRGKNFLIPFYSRVFPVLLRFLIFLISFFNRIWSYRQLYLTSFIYLCNLFQVLLRFTDRIANLISCHLLLLGLKDKYFIVMRYLPIAFFVRATPKKLTILLFTSPSNHHLFFFQFLSFCSYYEIISPSNLIEIALCWDRS